MPTMIDISGQRFGRLTAVCATEKNARGTFLWRCACDCGGVKVVSGAALRAGKTRSCGCLLPDIIRATKTTHGHSKKNNVTTEYKIWGSMRKRCENKNASNYERYGGRGVTVCERWHSFENFLADMGSRPFHGAELDRKDNDGPYSPDNCQWATPSANSRNRRSGRDIDTPLGKMPLWKASEVSGLSSGILAKRIDLLGWDASRLFDDPRQTCRTVPRKSPAKVA